MATTASCRRRVDPGDDFVQEDVIFDDEFYYCRVEPMLFGHRRAAARGVAGKDPAERLPLQRDQVSPDRLHAARRRQLRGRRARARRPW